MDDLTHSNCDVNLIDRSVEIEHLASLDPIAYETARTTAAERLGFRSAILDTVEIVLAKGDQR